MAGPDTRSAVEEAVGSRTVDRERESNIETNGIIWRIRHGIVGLLTMAKRTVNGWFGGRGGSRYNPGPAVVPTVDWDNEAPSSTSFDMLRGLEPTIRFQVQPGTSVGIPSLSTDPSPDDPSQIASSFAKLTPRNDRVEEDERQEKSLDKLQEDYQPLLLDWINRTRRTLVLPRLKEKLGEGVDTEKVFAEQYEVTTLHPALVQSCADTCALMNRVHAIDPKQLRADNHTFTLDGVSSTYEERIANRYGTLDNAAHHFENYATCKGKGSAAKLFADLLHSKKHLKAFLEPGKDFGAAITQFDDGSMALVVHGVSHGSNASEGLGDTQGLADRLVEDGKQIDELSKEVKEADGAFWVERLKGVMAETIVDQEELDRIQGFGEESVTRFLMIRQELQAQGITLMALDDSSKKDRVRYSVTFSDDIKAPSKSLEPASRFSDDTQSASGLVFDFWKERKGLVMVDPQKEKPEFVPFGRLLQVLRRNVQHE